MDRYPRVVGARELKTRLGRYLGAVRNGATLVVTERGEPVAELRPVAPRGRGIEARLDDLAMRGLVTKGRGGPLAPFAPIRTAGIPASKLIEQEREDRF